MTLKQVEAELPGVYLDAVVAVEAPATRLHLFNRAPEPDEPGVPVTAPIVVTILDTGAVPGIDAASVQVLVDGVVAYDGAAGGFQLGWTGAQSAIASPAANAKRLVLDHLDPFPSQAVVTVRVRAQTADGAEGIDQAYAFACEDVTAPKLVAVRPTGHRTLRVAFDEAVRAVDPAAAADALNATNYSVAPLTAPAVTPAVTRVDAEAGFSFTLTLDTDLTPSAVYELTVRRVEDAQGNVILAPYTTLRFAGYACGQPRGRRFDLWSWVPKKNRREDEDGSGDLRRFIACLQEVADLLLCDVDRWGDILDPDFAPEWAVDTMLADLGNPFTFEMGLEDKRRLLRVLVPLYKQKGTAVGIRNAVRFFLGLEITVTPYAEDTLLLGESALGEDWVLGISDRRARYSFDVTAPRVLTDTERARLRALITLMKRVGTHLIRIIEPTPPVVIDHVELGASELGDSFILH